jgi:hypothetical protein
MQTNWSTTLHQKTPLLNSYVRQHSSQEPNRTPQLNCQLDAHAYRTTRRR